MPSDMPPDSDSPWADAPLFHLFWKNGELNNSRAMAMGQRIARDAVRPAGTPAPVHRAGVVALPDAPESDINAWERRVSERSFSEAPATLPDLGRILHPLRMRLQGTTRLLPSGGAKYPMQVYVALCRLDGPSELTGQIAWYDNARHGLVPVCACPAWPELARMLGVDWEQAPAAVLFMIARPENMLAKYGERGGRFLLIEAGVYLGALGYQVAQADWSGCAIGSYHDEAVLSLLGLSAPRHVATLVYACGPKRGSSCSGETAEAPFSISD
ncbi:Nitroreductase [Bordetella tumbae]